MVSIRQGTMTIIVTTFNWVAEVVRPTIFIIERTDSGAGTAEKVTNLVRSMTVAYEFTVVPIIWFAVGP